MGAEPESGSGKHQRRSKQRDEDDPVQEQVAEYDGDERPKIGGEAYPGAQVLLKARSHLMCFDSGLTADPLGGTVTLGALCGQRSATTLSRLLE